MLLDCAPCVEKIKRDTKEIVDELPFLPQLATILVGDNSASEIYVKNKKKVCYDVGIRTNIVRIPYKGNEKETLQEIVHEIVMLNQDKYTNGILLQLPLPKELSVHEEELRNLILPSKDIDGLTLIPILSLWSNTIPNFLPCTIEGIYLLLQHYHIDIEGKTVLVVGRSNLLGKPLALSLLQLNATPIVCHTYTKNLAELAKQADIIISAAGAPGIITKDMIRDEQVIVLDAGISRTKNTICGDVCFEEVAEKALVTPVPGGIGRLTTAVVALHTAQAARCQYYHKKKG